MERKNATESAEPLALPKIELYTRVHCHLCEVAKTTLERVRAEAPFELETIDVDSDPELAALYGMEVPVVLLDGKKVAKFRVDPAALLRRLKGAS
ncbi:MAG: glutaredoxin family protein [Polyangia bacterium]|jgi:glutaredoxin